MKKSKPQPQCPKCGKSVILFTYSEMKRWYHVTDGIPDPRSSACEAPHGY